MGTSNWPKTGTYTWPPVGTFSWPRTGHRQVGMLIKYARAEVVVWWGATDHRERCRCLLQRMMVVLWWGIGS